MRPAAGQQPYPGTAANFITEPRAAAFPRRSYWSVAVAPATSGVMGEHVAQQNIERDRTNRKRPSKQTAAAIGHKLLEIIVYRKTCRIGDKLTRGRSRGEF